MPKLYIIDGSGIFHRAYHAYPEMTHDGKPVNAIYGYTDILWSCLEQFKQDATHIAVVFDAPGKNFRHDIYPEYKANRKEKDTSLVAQYDGVREATKAFNLLCIEKVGYEADDIIATYTRIFAFYRGQVVIVSSDKDLMQLVHDGRVEMYDPMKKKTIMSYDVLDKFGVMPPLVSDVLALMGDSSDNVPGVPGVGIKTAAELINQFGNVEAVLENSHKIKRQKIRDSVSQNKESALLSKKLVELDQFVPVENSIDSLSVGQDRPALLYDFLTKMGFNSLVSRLEDEAFS